MRMTLITGGRGMLATDLQQFLHDRGGFEVVALSRKDLDITDGFRVKEVIAQHKPDVVIHTAAIHVDPCEDDPRGAYRVNAWGTRSIARACELSGAQLVYISTCGLFGDRLRAFSEYDPVVLKTKYARSKFAGESYVRDFCERHFIVRPGWLFGGSIHHAKNFVVRRYEEAIRVSAMRSVYDKHGSPTYTGDVADSIVRLLETDDYGIYHVTNQGAASRAAYVRRIVKSFGLETVVEEVDSSFFPRKADVPDCEVLSSFNLGFVGLDELPPWSESLDRYVGKIKRDLS